MNPLKIVGNRDAAGSPGQSLRTVFQLQRMAAKLGQWKTPRGFVVKGKTREEATAKWEERLQRTTQK